jgi:phenylalanyl-tRNA synthetase alpha chain
LDAEAYRSEALAAVEGAGSVGDLDDARIRFLGRKSELKQALRDVRDRDTGMALNATREAIEEAIAAKQAALERAELDRSLSEETIDITLPGDAQPRGHLHLITQVRREVEDIFLGMGYEVVEGREVETTRYLFDALNMPPNHPTRSPLHTFYLNGDVVLRTETSPAQVHTMEEREPPIYMVSLGRCYRRDTADATHYPIFHQVEGLAVDENITLADLQGTLQHLLRSLFGEERETRFGTHFFPFTEPSIEAYVSCFLCDGAGCRVCKHSGWIEIGGAGVVDPNVFEFVGYDPEKVTGFAFGWGLERIAMFRHGLPDIRALWENDLRVLEQF